MLSSVCSYAAGQPEEIFGFTTDYTGITFQVKSYGCTEKSDFSFEQIETLGQVTLLRDNMDTCESVMPYGVSITFTYSELGFVRGSEFYINNKINNKITVY